jgi:hypothetical protein
MKVCEVNSNWLMLWKEIVIRERERESGGRGGEEKGEELRGGRENGRGEKGNVYMGNFVEGTKVVKMQSIQCLCI